MFVDEDRTAEREERLGTVGRRGWYGCRCIGVGYRECKTVSVWETAGRRRSLVLYATDVWARSKHRRGRSGQPVISVGWAGGRGALRGGWGRRAVGQSGRRQARRAPAAPLRLQSPPRRRRPACHHIGQQTTAQPRADCTTCLDLRRQARPEHALLDSLAAQRLQQNLDRNSLVLAACVASARVKPSSRTPHHASRKCLHA